MFVDDLTEHLSDLLTANRSNIILGDFNMHVDEPMDTEANIFNDTFIAFGLLQHANISTHNHGNTLDLKLSKVSDAIKVGMVETGASLSAHKMVYTALSIKKQHAKIDKVIIQKLFDH